MPKLTDRFLTTLTVRDGRKDRLVFDTVCPGLGVRVTAKGTRTFITQWTDPATKRKVREPLGVWGNLTIEKAREAAQVRLGQVAKGINPRTERLKLKAEDDRDRAETALTLDALIDDWATLHLKSRSERYRVEAQRAVKHAFPDLLKRPAARISRADVLAVLDKMVKAGKATMAGRTLAYARAAYRWAMKRGKVASNPFLELPIATVTASRDRVLSDPEVAEVWKATEGMGYPWGPFYQMAMLTLQRREEVAGMRWPEISPDLRLWTIPGERMKNGKPHDVHLSKAVSAVLETIRTEQATWSADDTEDDGTAEPPDLVFTTTGVTPISGFSAAKITLDTAIVEARAKALSKTRKKPAPLAPWRLHDLRRTGVSTLARLGFDSIVVDMLLAHQPAKLQGVARVYQRHSFTEERARALDFWAAHVLGTAEGNVVSFSRAVS